MKSPSRMLLLASLVSAIVLASCDPPADRAEVRATASAGDSASVKGGDGQNATRPEEIYFDLTRFNWYQRAQPLMHNGRSYMPQADPTTVETELKPAGAYQGVTYYVAEDAPEPVYTLYVPVYYRYWQRFTAPPGS